LTVSCGRVGVPRTLVRFPPAACGGAKQAAVKVVSPPLRRRHRARYLERRLVKGREDQGVYVRILTSDSPVFPGEADCC